MTNYAWGLSDSETQARVVAELVAAGFDARPIKRMPGLGVGIRGAAPEDEDRLERAVLVIDPAAHRWPPGSFVR